MKRIRATSTDEEHTDPSQNQAPQSIALSSLQRSVTPPSINRQKSSVSRSTTAAVEAGKVSIEDHVGFFSHKLLSATRSQVVGQPRLSHQDWLALYNRNLNDTGHHFVIHQHDHPVAGTHYDLRLQCNATSSISFAIMYGLPGDPNSRRLNRNATETRVHNLWNHLIETASHDTGTMLLWDTGEYEVLPYESKKSKVQTDSEGSAAEPEVAFGISTTSTIPEPIKLHHAFQRRKVKLRLHGTRLPQGYTISLRLTHDNFRSEQPQRLSYSRKRKRSKAVQQKQYETSDSEGSNPLNESSSLHGRISSLQRTASPPPEASEDGEAAIANASDAEDETIRLTNAYPGATNNINSIHQRKWYLSMDRLASGFIPTKTVAYGQRIWRRNPKQMRGHGSPGVDRFHVLGRDYETSVVTGRLAKDILADEGVVGFVPRGLWKPVIE